MVRKCWEFSQSAKEWGRDEAKARESRKMFAEDNKTPLAITRNAAVGSPETIARTLAEVIDAGDFDWIAMYFPDYIEDLRIFGEQILPALHNYGVQPAGGHSTPVMAAS